MYVYISANSTLLHHVQTGTFKRELLFCIEVLMLTCHYSNTIECCRVIYS